MFVSVRERQRERERGRQAERDRDKERQTHRVYERDGERQTERQTERQREMGEGREGGVLEKKLTSNIGVVIGDHVGDVGRHGQWEATG